MVYRPPCYHRVQKLSSGGAFVTMWGSSGAGQGQFSGPRGVALASSRIYVVDTNNSRLQAFDWQTTAGWAYNQIGNMTINDGRSYVYEGPRPHAVTRVDSNGASAGYAYDANGSMTTRGAQTLTWDARNRLTAVSGGVGYVYDGDGFRVKKTENGVTIVYVNRYYEKNLSTGAVTLYYYLGGKMTAYKTGTDLKYLHQDHLSGTSITTTTAGNLDGSIKYTPFGQTRASSGALPAHKFTGQRLDDVGLYYYGARYYDPALARFISADSVVSGNPGGNSVVYDLMVDMTTAITGPGRLAPSSPQSLNRYSYVLNNPLKYIDPNGNQEEEENENEGGNGDGGSEDWSSTGGETAGTGAPADNPEGNPSPVDKNEKQPDGLTETNKAVTAQLTGQQPSDGPKPDYRAYSANIAIPNPITLTLVGIGLQLTFDRYGNIYLGGGISIGKSATGLSVREPWAR